MCIRKTTNVQPGTDYPFAYFHLLQLISKYHISCIIWQCYQVYYPVKLIFENRIHSLPLVLTREQQSTFVY